MHEQSLIMCLAFPTILHSAFSLPPQECNAPTIFFPFCQILLLGLDPINFLTEWGIRNEEAESRLPPKGTGLLTAETNFSYIKVINV